MDVATLFGFLAAMGMLIWSIWIGCNGQIQVYWDMPSAILVIGGAVFLVLITQPIEKYLAFFRVVKSGFFVRNMSVSQAIEIIVQLGEEARRNGILALESFLPKIPDEFLRSGIQFVVDGTGGDEIEKILTSELEAMDQRHGHGKAILDLFAKYAPALGMIGTLLGLVAMLLNMDDPKKIGPGMAVAILTTLYGAIIANMICLPLSDKLSHRHDEEMLLRTVMLKGVLSLQAGDNPRVTQAKLAVYLPARHRKLVTAGSNASK